MSTEEQLELAYITIAELRDQNSKMIDMIAGMEKRMSAAASEERRVLEDFYHNQLEAQREAHEKEREAHEKEREAHEKERTAMRATIDRLTEQTELLSRQIAELTGRLVSSKAKERTARGDLYGKRCEKISVLHKRRDDDDRSEGKDNFDGTPGSDASTEDGKLPSSKTSGKDASTIEGIQKKILRTHPGAEVSVERIDYSKAKSYMDDSKLHKLEEYYVLPEGGHYLMRDGKIDLNYVRIIIRYPERYEEHLYETATVRFKDDDDIRTIDTLEDLDRPVKGCCFGTSTLVYILMEKFWYNTTFEQIVRKLRMHGIRMSKSTLGDNVHRAIDYMRVSMTSTWENALLKSGYWMIDETPGLIGCENEDGTRSYKKKYFWTITAKLLNLTWLSYEMGSRGKMAIARFMDRFVGFYTTDGYACYKLWDMDDEAQSSDSVQPMKKRSACLVHIRRPFVKALMENYDSAMWFIEVISKIFSQEYLFKQQNLTGTARWIARHRKGSVSDLMKLIEVRLCSYKENNYIGCGELLKKAVAYALAEWPAMKRVLENGDVEISNNLSEQSVRKLKMNLRNAGNIGSESSAKNNAFMYSVIESCRHNKLDLGRYLTFLLDKLKGVTEGQDLTGLLPCYCGAV